MSNQEVKEGKSDKTFWQSVPLLITAFAALITAIGGCIAVIFGIPAISNAVFGTTPTPIISQTISSPTQTPYPTYTPFPATVPPNQAPSTEIPPATSDNNVPFTIDSGSRFAGITITKVEARVVSANIEFRFDYTSDADRQMFFFNPPQGDTIGIRMDVPAGTNYVLVTVSADELRRVSDITVSFYLPNQQQPDFIFLDFQKIKSIIPSTSVVPSVIDNNVPFTTDSDSRFAGITITKVEARAVGANIEFRFDYTSDADRQMFFFNPPQGDTIGIRKDVPAGTNYVLVIVSADELRKVSDITVSFYLPNQQQPDFIFLDFQKIKSLIP